MSTKKSNSPRRPLSAYNLFYRYKRAKIIEANNGSESNRCETREAVYQLIESPPGLEGIIISNRVRRANIRLTLAGKLFSTDTTNRLHRKSTHGYKMTFLEMNKIMVNTWKVRDDFANAVFRELADEARREYKRRLNEYNNEKHVHFYDIGIKEENTSSSTGEAPPKLKTPVPEEEVPPASSNAKTLIPNDVESISRGSELTSSWNILPFPSKTQKLTQASPDGFISFIPSAAKPNLPLLTEKIYQPKRLIPQPYSQCAFQVPPTYSPIWGADSFSPDPSFFSRSLMPPPFPVETNSSDAGKTNESASSNASVDGVTDLFTPLALDGYMPSFFDVETTGPETEESTPSDGSSFNKLSPDNDNGSVSADDFLELIWTLDQRL